MHASKVKKSHEDHKYLFEFNKDVEVISMNDIQFKLTEVECVSKPYLSLSPLDFF